VDRPCRGLVTVTKYEPDPDARPATSRCRSSSKCHVTGITQPIQDLAGAKWGAIIGRHGATSGLAGRSKYVPEPVSSHGELHWRRHESSFESRESPCL
jgi:hypothetical protein